MEGFNTVIVTDGDTAVYLAEKIKPDMVILNEPGTWHGTAAPGVFPQRRRLHSKAFRAKFACRPGAGEDTATPAIEKHTGMPVEAK